jgi:predicted metal-binding protein
MNIVKMSVAAAPLQILLTLLLILCGKHASSYSVAGRIRQHPLSLRYHSLTTHSGSYFFSKSSEDDNNDQLEDLSSSPLLTADEILAARQFKIVTCNASSCATKRKKLRLDEYATYTLLYERLYQNQLLDVISIEETSCLGSCSMAPCVAIEHEEYDGTVALMGMDPSEFQLRAFHQVVDHQDAQRIWDILLQSIKIMAQESHDEHETDFNNDDDDDVDDDNPNAV